jgi:hypothetical protein
VLALLSTLNTTTSIQLVVLPIKLLSEQNCLLILVLNPKQGRPPTALKSQPKMSSQPRNSYRSPFLSPLTPSHIHPSNHELHSGSRPMYVCSVQKGEDHQETVDVVWNPMQVHVDLQKACQILTHRQLKCSAKWIAEMAVGLSISAADSPEENVSSMIPDHFWSSSTTNHPALFQYARTLLDLGDYTMAASVLSVGTVGVAESALTCTMPPPLPNLSASEVFVRSYALYMAGEKCKEEQILELERCVVVCYIVTFSCIIVNLWRLRITQHFLFVIETDFWNFTARDKRIPYVAILIWRIWYMICIRNIKRTIWTRLVYTFMVWYCPLVYQRRYPFCPPRHRRITYSYNQYYSFRTIGVLGWI